MKVYVNKLFIHTYECKRVKNNIEISWRWQGIGSIGGGFFINAFVRISYLYDKKSAIKIEKNKKGDKWGTVGRERL